MKRKKPAPLNEYVVRLRPSLVVIWHVEAESMSAALEICADVLPPWVLGWAEVGPVSK